VRAFLAIRIPLDQRVAGVDETAAVEPEPFDAPPVEPVPVEPATDSLRRDQLRQLLGEFASLGTAVRPVADDGVHLTLKFFGELSAEQVETAGEVTGAVVAEMFDFDLHLRGLGAFPSERRPSVIWAGVADGGECGRLVRELELALGEAGFPAEARPFQPHVTLARIKARPPARLAELLAEFAAADFGCLPVSTIELVASELRPGGPRYSTLAKFRLGAGPRAVERSS